MTAEVAGSPASVLIVDDHPVVRQGLEGIVRSATDLVVVGAVDSAADALAWLRRKPADAMLLDLRLRDGDGMGLLAELRTLTSPPRTVIVSSHEGDAMVTRALEAGAMGYVSKNAPAPELLAAIRAVLRGETFVSSELRRQLRNGGGPTITAREIEVLTNVALGLSNQDIAGRLGCAEKTVKNHLNSIFVKLNASDRTHAVMIALERGFIAKG